MSKRAKSTLLSKKEKKECENLKERHIDTLLSASESYNKAILTLSTASLGYTFVFYDSVSKANSPINCICLLIIIWILLILSIALILASLLADQSVSQKKILRYQSMAKDGVIRPPHEGYDKIIMEKFPIYSGLCFLFAIVLFTLLMANNM
jgi:hypothetical protein